ncbi:MAG: pilus assembly protein TadE [Micrococcales bacterium]|nr:pilus assembly protein TadE [Micrococcales bacterium]
MRTSSARGGGAARLHHRIRASAGMFTAELAVGLLAVIPVVLALVGVVAAGAVQVQTTEAARTAARMLARGDDEVAVREQVVSALPGAQVRIHDEAGRLRVEVSRVVGGRGLLPRFTMRAEVRTVRET